MKENFVFFFFLHRTARFYKDKTVSFMGTKINQHSTGLLTAAGTKLTAQPDQLIIKGGWSQKKTSMGLPEFGGFIMHQLTLVFSSHSSGRTLDTFTNQEKKTKYGKGTTALLSRNNIGLKIYCLESA